MVDVTAVGEVRPRRVLTAKRRPARRRAVCQRARSARPRRAWRCCASARRRRPAAGRRPSRRASHRYLRPEPRVRLGRAIAQARAATGRDGFERRAGRCSSAAGRRERMRRRDRRGRVADRAGGARVVGRPRARMRCFAAMSGGDDYELLFAVPRAWRGRLRHARIARRRAGADEDRRADERSRRARVLRARTARARYRLPAEGLRSTCRERRDPEHVPATHARSGGKLVATIGAAWDSCSSTKRRFRDSRVSRRWPNARPPPQPGSRLHFTATAYCKGETTASGVSVRTGIAAADPALLPVGTVVRLDTPDAKLDGIWTVMDTGPAVQGRTIDLYLWSCHDALRFGRRPIQLEVLRLGWNSRQRRSADSIRPEHCELHGRRPNLSASWQLHM